MNNEKIEEEFEDIIREKLTDRQFWNWVKGWKDVEMIVEEALGWDIETKEEALKELKKIVK